MFIFLRRNILSYTILFIISITISIFFSYFRILCVKLYTLGNNNRNNNNIFNYFICMWCVVIMVIKKINK